MCFQTSSEHTQNVYPAQTVRLKQGIIDINDSLFFTDLMHKFFIFNTFITFLFITLIVNQQMHLYKIIH